MLNGGTPVTPLCLLESAVAQPEAGFGDQYLHTDVFEMASAYLYHLVMNHPFVDGNKRVGLEGCDRRSAVQHASESG